MLVRRLVLPIASLILLSACSLQTVSCQLPSAPERTSDPTLPELAPAEGFAATDAVGVVFLGDSITAGLGLPSEQAYPAVLQPMFEAEGYAEVTVINAGVSGDTTAGGLRRVENLMQPGVRVLVVALGGNDALRGLTPAQTRDNLFEIIDLARGYGVEVLVAGMQAPTNLGTDYQDAFRGGFREIASYYGNSIEFVPFLLEGVAGDPALNQPDGIHPNAIGARVIAELLYPRLRVLVDLVLAGRGPGA